MKQFSLYLIILFLTSCLLLSCAYGPTYTEEELNAAVSEAEEEAYSLGYEDAYEEWYQYAYAEGYSVGEQDGYYKGLEEGYDSGWSDSNIEAVEEYYEGLCAKYGYLTYWDVCYPWRQEYIDPASHVSHLDWLCPEADHTSIIELNDDIYSDYELCSRCSHATGWCYLDLSTSAFHSSPSHLSPSTEDYIHPLVEIKLVTYDSAISNGYSPCPDCYN